MARIAHDMYVARRTLIRVRESLGHGFGLLDAEPAPPARDRPAAPMLAGPAEPREQLV
jgi:hypothetical protein